MGFLKNWLIEQHERGYYWIGDKYVCDDCVDDEALRRYISDNAEATACSYCGRQSDEPIACELDRFMGALASGIAVDWEDAIEFMPYDGGDWALPQSNRTIHDLLADGELGIEVDQRLFDDIVEAFRDRTFAPRYYFGLGPDERLIFGWDAFVEQVTHRTRYLFLTIDMVSPHASGGEIPPSRMLSEIGRLAAEVGLVRELPAGSTLYRARLRERGKTPLVGAKDLGSPPIQRALVSNRMSPSGIATFYGAFDEATAMHETTPGRWPEGRDVTVGVFRTARPFAVLDLPTLPPVPSLFDEEKREVRPLLIFLDRFAAEVSKPIERDEREHLEYVPTQIVTEYFRHAFTAEQGLDVDGIVYRSAMNSDGKCIVLFVDNDDCVDDDGAGQVDGTLALVSAYCPVGAVGG